ncbi:MAG TPA: protein kinase [Blastocatellia bacterium]|nr:protein kinase [Blastocatellia bacterium]
MPIAPNTSFNHYEIIAPLGKGGMGEVYRAKDTRLNREVAIKVLPADFAQDAGRLRRFEQEARATLALNHPNIMTVYDFGTGASENEGNPYLVMELLEGENLRAQLGNGALPVRKAIEYAQQIVAGLAAAHDKGIVHRDLKPENLFVTKDGRVKILDFGLAKLRNAECRMQNEEAETLLQAEPNNPPSPIQFEALPRPQLTAPGTVLGTVAYMSPEQVRGEAVDHRSDIFSFGLILFEMLTGKRAFQRATMAETMTAILKDEAPELSEINAKVSPQLENLVQHCLEKNPELRLQSAHDLGFVFEELAIPNLVVATQPEVMEASNTALVPKVSGWRDYRWAGLVAAALLLGSFGITWAYLLRKSENAATRMIKLDITPPANASFESFALSPDGHWFAFTAITGGKVQLWLRALNATEAKVLPGTEGALYPFWSPDSQWIAFFSSGKLKKLQVLGGPAQILCDARNPTGGTWNRDGMILFSMISEGIRSVSATGGVATALTSPNRSGQETAHLSPTFLPDGKHFLYTVMSWKKEKRGIYLGLLDSQLKVRLLEEYSSVLYAPPGFLLFRRDAALLAQPFDADKLQLRGEAFQVAERVGHNPFFLQRLNVSVSNNGVLVLEPHVNRLTKQLHWLDRSGKLLHSFSDWYGSTRPALSPDEKRFVADRRDPVTSTYDLWMADVSGANASRFTFDIGDARYPIWSSSGSRIIWTSTREDGFRLFQKAANGAGKEEPMSDFKAIATDWSRDERFIFFNYGYPKPGEIWVQPLAEGQQPFLFIQAEGGQTEARLSPDGHWLAYVSDESDRLEIYVQRFPTGGNKKQVSTNGGAGPYWRRDGKELFYYASDGKLMAVPVVSGDSCEMGTAVPLFEFRSGSNAPATTSYTVTGDGQRFLVNAVVDAEPRAPLTVVLNWTVEAKK